MNPLTMLRLTPGPAKFFMAAYLTSFAVAFGSVLVGAGAVGAVAGVALGASAVALGLCLLADISGSASEWARVMRETKPFGVDYSQSFLATPTFVRFFGAFMMLVGLGMAAGFVTEA